MIKADIKLDKLIAEEIFGLKPIFVYYETAKTAYLSIPVIDEVGKKSYKLLPNYSTDMGIEPCLFALKIKGIEFVDNDD